jgi:hypothetical protein
MNGSLRVLLLLASLMVTLPGMSAEKAPPTDCELRIWVLDKTEYSETGAGEPPVRCRGGPLPGGKWALQVWQGGRVFRVQWERATLYGLAISTMPEQRFAFDSMQLDLVPDKEGLIAKTPCIELSPYKVVVSSTKDKRHVIRANRARTVSGFRVTVGSCGVITNLGRCTDVPEFECHVTAFSRR